ncbi:hypothetical protein EV193_11265 [Herbihabitans rhizosphaerae]|uniref:Uncharacterized protein n=1 Tax=Herbihabitans rhizosphaerae TaxID=1872711 RepID=A0A4Q7KED2_9PSEU|nr:hypothetical protein [Herbihabitans rhizosphaerae]RZS32431.1 hypothetical protein EV193_11265 [Herbihabitans rhizosphaerae]
MKLLPRLLSPAGFLLALVLFLLPFVSVSCEVSGVGEAHATYTGLDMATGGEPDIVRDLPKELLPEDRDLDAPPRPDVQPLAIVTMLLIALGAATVLIPALRTRLAGTAAAAAVAAIMLGVTQLVAMSGMDTRLREVAGSTDAQAPADLSRIIGDAVQTKIGFWLVMLALAMIAAGNVGALVNDTLERRRAEANGDPPEPDE